MEGPKHLTRIFLVKPGAVVPDIIDNLIILLYGTEFYAGVLGFSGELPGIPEQV
jgi:hypothetical protein